jgi:hypothetical protein
LANKTGVITDSASYDLLIGSSSSFFDLVYLGAIGLNSAILVFVAVYASRWKASNKRSVERELPEDLWSSQK